MDMIEEKFKVLKEKNESALILYFTFGFPTVEKSTQCIVKIARAGADIIEIGIPFSDPVADGKTIQHASFTALKNGVNLEIILKKLSGLRLNIPVIVMSYLNPILSFGVEKFFKRISDAGVSGVIIPDLIAEESHRFKKIGESNSIVLIQLIAPTSGHQRIKKIGDCSDGFVYCVTVTGVTGARKKLPVSLKRFVKRVKLIVGKPVVAGFGISTPEQVKEISKFADGVVIGSRIIEAVRNRENLTELIKRFKNATIRREEAKCSL
ncbi:MAG: tryptophan synthase subunit alpha [candidate division WOR-3 bacterium]